MSLVAEMEKQIEQVLVYFGESSDSNEAAKKLFSDVARFKEMFDTELQGQQVIGNNSQYAVNA